MGCCLVLLLQALPAQAFKFNLGDIDLNKIGSLISNATDAVTDVDEEKEREIGTNVAAYLLGAAPLVDNAPLQEYINRVGQWVASQTERPDLEWRFGVLDTSNVNAFAAPGGYVFITKGLFLLMNNEAELAGVLAHEIGHVLRRHHLEAIKKKAQAGLLGDVLSMAAGDHSGAMAQLALVGTSLYASGLDKADEYQADEIGIVLSQRSGYDAYGLLSVLATLGDIKPEAESMALMNATHPSIADRLARLEALDREGIDTSLDAPRLEDRFRQIQYQVLRQSGFEPIQ